MSRESRKSDFHGSIRTGAHVLHTLARPRAVRLARRAPGGACRGTARPPAMVRAGRTPPRRPADGLSWLGAETATAAAHAAATLPAEAKVATQGHVLFAGDFMATLAVEATVHHLDLSAGDESLAGPSGPGLAVARETLDGVLGKPVPVGWDDVGYVLKATGRAD